MRYELEPIQYVLRVYDKDPDDYIASAMIRLYGDHAWVSNISSPRLFEAMNEYLDEVFSRLGIVVVEGYMNPAIARALRMASRKTAFRFQIVHHGLCAGRSMPWISISRL